MRSAIVRIMISTIWAMFAPGLYGEGRVGNGGDSYAAEFTTRGRLIASHLSSSYSSILSPEKFQQLRDSIENIPVRSTEGTLSDIITGNQVDAIVTSQQGHRMILLSRSRIHLDDLMRGDHDTLVLHEYLRVIDVDDENYRVSSTIDFRPIRTHIDHLFVHFMDSRRLEEWVLANIPLLERAGAAAGYPYISFDEHDARRRTTCLGLSGWSNPVVGQCVMTGDIGYPNSSSVFAVTIFEQMDDTQLHVRVEVLTGEDIH